MNIGENYSGKEVKKAELAIVKRELKNSYIITYS
jgi:hypothetical protein